MSTALTQMHEYVIETVHEKVGANIAMLLQLAHFKDKVAKMANALVVYNVGCILQSQVKQSSVVQMLQKLSKA